MIVNLLLLLPSRPLILSLSLSVPSAAELSHKSHKSKVQTYKFSDHNQSQSQQLEPVLNSQGQKAPSKLPVLRRLTAEPPFHRCSFHNYRELPIPSNPSTAAAVPLVWSQEPPDAPASLAHLRSRTCSVPRRRRTPLLLRLARRQRIVLSSRHVLGMLVVDRRLSQVSTIYRTSMFL